MIVSLGDTCLSQPPAFLRVFGVVHQFIIDTIMVIQFIPAFCHAL